MLGRKPVGHDVRCIGLCGARGADAALARQAQQLAVDGDAGARIDLVERHGVVIVANRKGIAAQIQLQIGAPVGMRDIGEGADLKRPGRHHAFTRQQIARHRHRCANAEETLVAADILVQPVGHGKGQMLDHPFADIG